MKDWGLAAAGSASRTFLRCLPSLPRRLGPVASTSYRLASRIANALKAGYAAKEISELDNCPVILLCAPAGTLDRMVKALATAGLDWKNKALLLCDSSAYTSDLPQLCEQGAAIVSINSIEGLKGQYIIEGDRKTLREARLLVRDLGGKAVEIVSSNIRLFDAARTLAGSLFTPLIETCTECIRQAGIPGPEAPLLAEALLQRSLRAFMRAGRKSWSGPISRAERDVIDREFKALAGAKPLMGEYFRCAADFAFDLYRTFPELTRYDLSRIRGKA